MEEGPKPWPVTDPLVMELLRSIAYDRLDVGSPMWLFFKLCQPPIGFAWSGR